MESLRRSCDPGGYLRQTMAQRRSDENYGDEILQPGESYGDLRKMRMWMTYLHHRWAIDTARGTSAGCTTTSPRRESDSAH